MKSVTSKSMLAARLFLGLVFTVFGLNGFLGFMPMPEPPPAGGAFLGALAATGYMFPLIKGTEVVAGVMLLAGRAVPLALVMLVPITINILAYHTVLAPAPALPIALIAAQAFLIYSYRERFLPLLGGQREQPASERQPARSIASSAG